VAIRITAAPIDIGLASGGFRTLDAQRTVSHFGLVNQAAQENGEGNGYQQPADQDIQEHCVSSRSNCFDGRRDPSSIKLISLCHVHDGHAGLAS
jgi:hypothetical protein